MAGIIERENSWWGHFYLGNAKWGLRSGYDLNCEMLICELSGCGSVHQWLGELFLKTEHILYSVLRVSCQ